MLYNNRGSSSTPFKPTKYPISPGSSLPEAILPSDEGYHHPFVPAAYVSKNFDLAVIEHDKDSRSSPIFTAHVSRTIDLLSVIEDYNHPRIPVLPTRRTADSSHLLIDLKSISCFNDYADLFYIGLVLQVRAHELAPLTSPVGSPSFNCAPPPERFHPYRNPAVRHAKPPPWLRGTYLLQVRHQSRRSRFQEPARLTI